MCGSITEKLDSVCASSNGLMPPCKLPPEDAAVVGACEASEGFKPAFVPSRRMRKRVLLVAGALQRPCGVLPAWGHHGRHARWSDLHW